MPGKVFRWRDVARYALLAILGGAFISFVISGLHWNIRGLLHGGLIGLFCFAGAMSGESLFHRWLIAAPNQWWRRALVYFIGGQIGWTLAMVGGPRVRLSRGSRRGDQILQRVEAMTSATREGDQTIVMLERRTAW